MSKTLTIILLAATLQLTSCCMKHKEISTSEGPLRLTVEEVLEAPDGDRIIVYFPIGVEEPVVIQSNETGGWVAAGKVPPP